MQLSPDLIADFQRLHLKTFGEQISPEAAELELSSLAELLRITHPLKIKDNENEE